jgi:hypothetical protein
MRYAALAAIIAFGPGLPHGVLAYTTSQCVGQPIRWDAPSIDLDIMPCSAPPGSNRATDLQAAIAAWNAVGGMRSMFRVAFGAAACSVRVNGVNELGYVEPRFIDGARGMTRTVYARGCRPAEDRWSADQRREIVEADVLISADPIMRNGLPPDCVEPYAFLRRATALHELGHVLGLGHYDEQVTHMNTSAAPGRYCGVRAFEPHPDDRAGARRLYPNPGVQVRDVGASAFKLDGPNNVVRVMQSGEPQWLCPGQIFRAHWSAANLGTSDTLTDIHFYVSDNDIISAHDHLAGVVRGVVLPAGSFITDAKTIRVPRGLAPGGPYYVGFVVDAERDDWELPASNNSTYTSVRIFVNDPESFACP